MKLAEIQLRLEIASAILTPIQENLEGNTSGGIAIDILSEALRAFMRAKAFIDKEIEDNTTNTNVTNTKVEMCVCGHYWSHHIPNVYGAYICSDCSCRNYAAAF